VGIDSLRRYDVQASYGQALALFSVLPLLAGAFLAWRNYHGDVGQIIYESRLFLAAFAGSVLVSMAAAALGCVLGFNSAGQRRNDKPRRSWMGFFIGGGVLTFDVILLIAFMMLRLDQGG
jgi:hypothetical protein